MYAPTEFETFFLNLLNESRAKVGAKPLTFDGELLQSADAHSLWMGQTGIYSHTGVNGSNAGGRMKDAGYGWSGWAENIYLRPGPLSEEAVRYLHEGFVNSPGHYANMINPAFEHVGIGLQIGSYGGGLAVYVTQNFGIPDAAERAETNDTGTGKDKATVKGTSGKDVLYGSEVADAMYGGKGNDTYYVGQRGDKAYEKSGEGTDKVFSSITYSLSGQDVENLTFYGEGNVNGTGNGLKNMLMGNSGANTLKGLGGNDTLNGNGGMDVLWGGSGKDAFVFDTAEEADGDTIRDFARRADRIDLRKIDANETAGGNQKFKFIGAQDFHDVAGELRAYQSGGKTYIAGDKNGDGTADFTITVSGTKTFASMDFYL